MIAALLIIVLTLGSAAVAMSLRNLIHSALLLILSWAGIAGFYLWAGADFVAFAQALVYIGAISMVVLFAVLLTRQTHSGTTVTSESTLRVTGAMLAAGGVGGLLGGAILGTTLDVPAGPAPVVTVRDLGLDLMGHHGAALLIVGVILTVSLIGAVVIAATDRPEEPKS
jgi:NADH:ubiquinone oxidoreductase subunit 6 (subunit J)